MIGKSLFDLRLKGAYLAPLILYFQYNVGNVALWLVLCSLPGAVVAHGIFRSIFGPGGPDENPLESTTATQRFYSVVFGKGPPENFPESHGEMLFNPPKLQLSLVRLVKIIFVIVTGLIWFYSNIVTLNILFSSGVPDTTSLSILYFAFVTWMLQLIIWEWFDPVYLEEMIEYGPDEEEQEEEQKEETGEEMQKES